ncbi:MAG: hypothetical protein C4519_18035 [Desulfobacteraceae bacterium]|nr:MAG: hypothetical protein C4519_18035 [Desulfobacteraceae bacterium]
MQSQIKEALGLDYEPLAILRTNEKPAGAKQFKAGRWGCVMFMLAAAVKGATAVFDRNTYGCQGGGVGLGFGNQYNAFPGGQEGFCYFLSIGNDQWETGRQVSEQIKPYLREEMYDDFVKGERYLQSPERVRQFIDHLPIMDIAEQFVVFKPLSEVREDQEAPVVIVFLADMDQIAAMTILANYHRPTNDNVIFPFAAGCQSMGIYAFAEAQSESPRAVLGLNDISARLAIKRMLNKDVLSFSVPYSLYREMEHNLATSFVHRNTWRHLRGLA